MAGTHAAWGLRGRITKPAAAPPRASAYSLSAEVQQALLLLGREVIAQRQHVLHHAPLQRGVGGDYRFNGVANRSRFPPFNLTMIEPDHNHREPPPLDYDSDAHPHGMEIDPAAPRRWAGRLGFLLIFLLVAALFAILLARFTNSMMLAIGLVLFMIAYMLITAVWASRHHRR